MKIANVLSFMEIYHQVSEHTMPMKVAYKFAKLAHLFESDVQFYQNKLRDLVDTYIEKDEKGNIVYTEDGRSMKIIAGKEEDCAKAMDELQNIEVDVEPIFTIDDFDGASFTPAQIQSLYPLIIED